MKVLLVKLSSLGDIVHTFPAVTDLARARPDVSLNWLVEEAFVPIVRLHPSVADVVPAALRRWRRRPLAHLGDLGALQRRLRTEAFDRVIDAQGLVKSAVLARCAAAPVTGFARGSAREGIAATAYSRCVNVPRDLHAIDRLRRLFAAAFDYAVPDDAPDFGLEPSMPGDEVVFLHGTTWRNKQWPEPFWRALARRITDRGYAVSLPGSGAEERARAERITSDVPRARVLPELPLGELVGSLAHARAVVTVDSGLGHLAAALGVPTLALLGPTDPGRTGCRGARAQNVAAAFACAPCGRRACGYGGERVLHDGAVVDPPCFASITPDAVWSRLEAWL